MTAPTERQQYYLDRLATNIVSAQRRYDQAEERILAAREQGIDTSTYDPKTSAQSGDSTLGKLQDLLDRSIRNHFDYIEKLRAKGVDL